MCCLGKLTYQWTNRLTKYFQEGNKFDFLIHWSFLNFSSNELLTWAGWTLLRFVYFDFVMIKSFQTHGKNVDLQINANLAFFGQCWLFNKTVFEKHSQFLSFTSKQKHLLTCQLENWNTFKEIFEVFCFLSYLRNEAYEQDGQDNQAADTIVSFRLSSRLWIEYLEYFTT